MSSPERFRRVIAVLCLTLLMVGVASAGDSAAEGRTFPPREFSVVVKNGEISSWEPVRRVFVTCGTNEFFFVLPAGLRMVTKSDKVTLTASDSSYFLTFRILTPTVLDASDTTTDILHQHLSARFPDSQNLQETSQTVAGRRGPAFDFQARIGGQVDRSVRVVLIPCMAGVLEFTMNVQPARASGAKNAFRSLLRSFRTNERGKIEVTAPVADRS